MRESLVTAMKNAERAFRRGAKPPLKKPESEVSRRLSDNYYILGRQAQNAARECRIVQRFLKDSELLPGLFERCLKMCRKGVLPNDEGIISFFSQTGLKGFEAEYLPLAITCALIDIAAKSVGKDGKNALKQLENAISSLRRMAETDFERISESLFEAEKILAADPAGAYPHMDCETKSRYRRQISALAQKRGCSAERIAKEALEKSQKSGGHIGKYIFPVVKSKRRGRLFLAMEVIMPLASSVAAAILFSEPIVGILLFFPLWELLHSPIEEASMRGVVPKRFPRLEASEELMRRAEATITVSVIMPSADGIKELESRLEELYLSNRSDGISVCCLADFNGSEMPKRPEDKLKLKALREAVDRLNEKYGGGFIAAVRPRSYSQTQEEFIGKERKRGAITELIRAVKGNPKGFLLLHGDTDRLERIKYLIALDADTQLMFDSAIELVAIAEHPLNRPVISGGRVVSGYGILVPRTENRLNSKSSAFAAVMAGDAGFSSYDSLSAEKYQDLFGEGIFSGKGLIDVDAYYELLNSGLPRETVLSHDIVESGYLRAGFVPDVQISEGFPQSVGSYYRRLHRWVRGDWQNIGFIFGKNPLNSLSRYKMFDNLRRSLAPAMCLASIFASMVIQGYEGITVAAVCLLAIASRSLFCAVRALLDGGIPSLSRLYFSKNIPAALNAFLRALMQTAFSARESFVCVDAASKAIWRLFVSKKKLLEWTTAAQSEGAKTLGGMLLLCIPSAAVSAALLIFGLPIHRLIGLIVLADIPLTLFSTTEIKPRKYKVRSGQREEVTAYAYEMWGFFDDLCGRENNFLPPDNIQFYPVRAIARRTSPTNIGLMLASFLAARDMGFISTAELNMRLNLSLGTVEKLEKYKGNLLNWYDTQTTQALNPRFVSTVDSGNFLCCLTALKEGLREYLPECPALEVQIKRIEKLIAETDLLPLFNERKKLFYIGIEPESGEKSASCYDLYMSEARMTAYFAVAKRIVSKKHWGALGRILISGGRYGGLASWTGTMFEYFMPYIFIPAPRGSLSRESLSFCLYCQKKRAGKKPFGISESGFYAFDGNLNYQYKAHGVQLLALKHGLDKETVVSPYSSFLTLPFAPDDSLKNLKRLSDIGAKGKYGFCEAVDYTRKINGKFAVVNSFMAHHVGMSLLSADNFLHGSCFQKRFMRDESMRGAESLLDEKIPLSAPTFKDIRTHEMPHIRERVQGKNVVSENPNVFSPKAQMLSNGRLSVCITDSGAGVSTFGGVDVTVNSYDPISRPQGIFAVFAGEEEVLPFVRAVDSGSPTRFRAEFFKNRAEHTAAKSGLRLKMKTRVLSRYNCEIRSFTVENTSRKNTVNGKLTVYFEPCLEKRAAYGAHPAFSKLFLTDEWDEENQCMLFSRRARDSDAPCAIAAGFIEKAQILHQSNREKALITPEGIFSLGRTRNFDGGRGNPDCCCELAADIELVPGAKRTLTLAVAVEESKEQALNTLLTVRAGNIGKAAVNPFYADAIQRAVAQKILPAALYPRLSTSGTRHGERCSFGRKELWSYGISGDLPIILIKINGEEDINAAVPYIRANKIMRSCGIATDLVIEYSHEEGYSSPIASAVRTAMFDEDCGLMLGVSGGVHLADCALHSRAEQRALEASAAFTLEPGKKVDFQAENCYKPLKTVLSAEHKYPFNPQHKVKQYNFTDGKIEISKTPAAVDIPWTMVFANKSFGTMVSDKSLGFTWAINSRENKLTPWYNDTMSDNRGELLIMKYNGVLYDIAALGRVEFTPEKAVWSAEIADVCLELTVSVAERGMLKKCSVKIENKSGASRNFDLLYEILPVMGVDRQSCGSFFAHRLPNGAAIEVSNSEIPGFSAVTCNSHADYVCFSRQDFNEGNYEKQSEEIPADACVAVGKRISLAAGGKASLDFYLSWGASLSSALKMPSVSSFGGALVIPKRICGENSENNLLFNSFLYSQIKQSRFYGRTGFSQCSGAYGFRDQLQDSLAFIDFEPNLTRVHIFRCAAVQFEQGDVLHWWHVLVDGVQKIRGVRTRCSDDMLWLAYTCAVYYEKTGDGSIFETEIPYILGEELAPDENERYFSPRRSDVKESVLLHCIRAVDFSLKFGEHGLALIGSCDWNDGFSKIGNEEAGESVWLSMFQKIVLEKTAPICRVFGFAEKADEYEKIAAKIEESVETYAWCGDRYARAFLKNGEILGKRGFIDILPQAFAAFSGIGVKNGRAETALKTAYEKLFSHGVIRLLAPPFDEEEKDKIGYIASYPAGIRENGGQYTHAAVWLAMAMLKMGKSEEAERLISSINPLSFYKDEIKAEKYRAEPYVLAGDVYFGSGITGRAGWTHFTGSAAWYYRCLQKHAENPDDKEKYV